MPERIYFDTSAFREIGRALKDESLAADLKGRILISPLAVFEVLSQLTIARGEEVLRDIHSVLNWSNAERTGMLPWPDDALFAIWFEKTAPDDGFTERMQRAFNVCLTADSVESLRTEAGQLKDVMDRMKAKTAQDFGRLLEAARKESPEGKWFSDAWFRGIANRVKADPNSKPLAEIASKLSAYHEFEQSKLQVALRSKDYNPEKHMNDLFDAEQLIYLSDPSLCILTCDTGFSQLVTKSAQAGRIVTASPSQLADSGKVEAVLRRITQDSSPAKPV